MDTILCISTAFGFDTKLVILGKGFGLQSLDDIIAIYKRKSVKEFRCTELPNLKHPLCMIYTSGRSGSPKAVIHTHKNFFSNTLTIRISSEKETAITSLPFVSISWISSVIYMFKAVIAHETKIVYPEFSEERTFEIIERFKASWKNNLQSNMNRFFDKS